jgi:cytosine/adenosine deaminase-related metal-dependent hydrolase
MLLIEHIHTLLCMDSQRRELRDAAVVIDGPKIVWAGLQADLPDALAQACTQRLSGRDRLVMPGMVNTHHHFYQTLTRALPGAQDAELFDWLVALYPVWARLAPEMVKVSTQVALTELMLSGCTTASDHHYLWPESCTLDQQFDAAAALGMRFHGVRGSMSVGRSQGGLPPDHVVEDEAFILTDSQRLIERFHDVRPYAMQRVVLAPCSPFSVSPDLMRESAALARSHARPSDAGSVIHLHTHLAETLDEERYCLEKFGMRPVDLAESLGWLGNDVWHAHCVHLNADEVARFASTGTGVAHCPSSNMRLASGIAPIRAMRDAGVRVSIAVDGSASNDGSHYLAEVRQAMMLQRVGSREGGKASAMSAREALEIASLGGASVLGRSDIGRVEVDAAADLVAFDLNHPFLAGAAVHDPVAALVFCQPVQADWVVINGVQTASEGQPLTCDWPKLVEQHNTLARALVRG